MLKKMLAGLAVTAIGVTTALPVSASSFPTRPMTMIVGVAPGGTLDTLARLLATAMSADLGQNVIVENTVGAGGLVGYKKLMDAAPDGYTLMFTNMSLVIIPQMHKSAGLNPSKDLDSISQVATVPMVLAVSQKSGFQNLSQMLTFMKANPGSVNLGSGGPGTTSHLAEALFLNQAGVDGLLVQYRGSGPAIVDVIAGNIEAIIDQTVTLMDLHRGEKLRAIAISSKERIPQMPNVPTFAEGGLPQFDLQIWNGVMAPKGLPADISARLVNAISKAIDSPAFKQRLISLAAQAPAPQERGSAPLQKIIERDSAMVEKLAKEAGLLAGN